MGATKKKSNKKKSDKPKKNMKKVKKTKKVERTYSKDNLTKAVNAVTNRGYSFRKAASTYGIPQTTLYRMSTKPNMIDCKKGPATILTEKEETEIVNWIIYRADNGFPVTKTDLIDHVKHYLSKLGRQTPFKDNRPGRHWYEGFRKRHPQIAYRVPQHLTTVRASVTQDDLREWFNEVHTYLSNKNLLNISPSRVFNCDETCVKLCPQSERVLTEKGSRAVYKVIDAFEKECVTTLFMYSAEGTRAPPMVLYSYKEKVPKTIIQNTPSGWGIGLSESGWMTIEAFYEYITNVFYPWLLREKIQLPIIIYLDGHSSHVTVPLVTFCREKKIEIISLYPNATHVLQPLDIAFFRPFKEFWKKTVPKWKVDNDITRLKKEQFALVLELTLQSMSEEKKIIKNGFRASGLMPFDPSAVQYDILKKKKQSKSAVMNDVQKANEIKNSTIEEKKSYLQLFENTLSDQLLNDFKVAESSGEWINDVEKKGLFEYWLNIKKAAGSSIVKPRIKHIDNLENHKVIVVAQIPSDISEHVITLDEGVLDVSPNNLSDEIEFIDNSNNVEEMNFDNISFINTENSLTSDSLHLSTATIDSGSIVDTVASNNINTSNKTPYSEDMLNKENKIPNIVQENSCLNNNNFTTLNNDITNASKDVSNNFNENKEVTSDEIMNTVEYICGETIKTTTDHHGIVHRSTTNYQENISEKTFSEVFTLPSKYLPTKKRIKLEAKGKVKPPAAGTSDKWWKIHTEKEKEKEIKENKAIQKKKLQEEKKKLQDQIKEIQKKIKSEK